jgi:PAS domain S-box-containing protein
MILMNRQFPDVLEILQSGKENRTAGDNADGSLLWKVLEDVINSSPAVVFVWKKEPGWPVEFVSRNIGNFGYRVEDFLSGSINYRDIMHPDDVEMVTEQLEKPPVEDKGQLNLQYRIMTKDGEARWVNERTSVHRYGDETFYQGIIVDITEQKKEDKALLDGALEMREALETVINSSPVIVFFWKAEEDWPVEFVSENISRFGYDVDDFLSGGMTYAEIVHSDDLEQVRQGMAESTGSGSSFFTQEYRILTKEGQVRWVDERTRIQRDDSGEITYLQGIIIDITEKKVIEHAFLQEDLRHEALLDLHLMKESPLEDILDAARKHIIGLTGSAYGFILWLERKRGFLEYVSSSGELIDENGRISEAIMQFCEKIVFSMQAQKVNDAVQLSRIREDTGIKDLDKCLGGPIFDNNIVTGVFWVAGKKEDYTESDLRQLNLFTQGMWDLIKQKRADEDLKRYAEELQRSIEIQNIMAEVIKSSPATVFLWKAEEGWPVEFVSDNVTQFGYTVEDFLSGKYFYADIIHPYDLERVQKELAKRMEEGYTDFSQEYRIMTKFGDMRWVDERTFIKHDEEGNVAYLQGIIVDVTERKHANDFMHVQFDLESVLSTATSRQESFEGLLEMALKVPPIDSGALYVADENTGDLNLVAHRGHSEEFINATSHYGKNSVLNRLVMTGNPVYKHHSELSSLTSGKSLHYEGLHATAVIPVQFSGDVIAALILSSHTEYEIPDNSRYDLEVIAAQAGEILGGMRSETLMHEQLSEFQSLVDRVPEAIMVINSSGTVLYSNLAARVEFGDENIIQDNFFDLLRETAESVRKIVETVHFKGEFRGDVAVKTKGDKTGTFEAVISGDTWDGKPCFVVMLSENKAGKA